MLAACAVITVRLTRARDALCARARKHESARRPKHQPQYMSQRQQIRIQLLNMHRRGIGSRQALLDLGNRWVDTYRHRAVVLATKAMPPGGKRRRRPLDNLFLYSGSGMGGGGSGIRQVESRTVQSCRRPVGVASKTFKTWSRSRRDETDFGKRRFRYIRPKTKR